MVKYVCSALLLMATSLSAAQLNDPTQPQLPAALLSEAEAHDQFLQFHPLFFASVPVWPLSTSNPFVRVSTSMALM